MVMGTLRQETELAIVGAGPGGYVAALRAADLGKEVVLIDERGDPGGVCLHEGCIPSKTLIHAAELLEAAREAKKLGITFGAPSIDLGGLRKFSRNVVAGLSRGVRGLLKKRGVELVKGRARFDGPNSLSIEGGGGVDFRHAIIASGSRPVRLPSLTTDGLWTSREALTLPESPDRLVVVGGGYIGLELSLVYSGLGSKVTLVEFSPRFLPGVDPDLVDVMVKSATRSIDGLMLESSVKEIAQEGKTYQVRVEHEAGEQTLEADRVLMAVGRQPNTDDLGLDNLGLSLDDNGRIPVDEDCRTAVPHIFAVGDVTPGPMLAHKASREAKVAAEVLAGQKSAFDNRAIPAVVYTSPEIAWAGLTEVEAKEKKIDVTVGRFPLKALGRARTLGQTEGLVKVLCRPGDGLVLGVGMVGPQASELIAEGTLALEMGATLEDLTTTIHPHPTLSEAIMEAAEVAAGSAVHAA